MKRLLIVGILATLTLFAGCSSATELQENERYNSPEIEEAEDGEIEESKESEININDFVITGQLQQPDSMGTIYYQATLTNNSSYPVKYADLKYNITKDGVKEGSYLTFSDTILAGETSSISECFGSDDMELISIELTLVDAEGNDIYVEYDVKLNQMEIW